MRRHLVIFIAVAGAALGFAPAIRADDDTRQLSPERLDVLDQLGYFTPHFKEAVHAYIDNKEALKAVNADQDKLAHELPGLQKKAEDAQTNAAALRKELAQYEHPEENDFDLLKQRMADDNAKPEDQLALAQAYVWTYPASPHAGEAQQYLEQVQKKLADRLQAKKDAEAARAAAHAALIQRAQARDLSLREWRDFLRDMSQDDVVRLMGRPSSQTADYWTYAGDWTTDPATNKRVGLEINFNAGRVLSVDEKPGSP